ncbi:MAG: hypothetical protein QOD47_726 [Gemmatimonadaceae bacterium]|jgi:hypothetical protein|nr:hypothetical protein [Gemmatimonadaceae bacterium]
MQSYRVVAVENRIGDVVRKTLRSPGFGHPAHTEVATGFGPCRQCLRAFSVGKDRRILFTYDAFYGNEALPLPGPVFIHEHECERYPEDGGFPVDLLSRRLTFNAYSPGRRLVSQSYVSNGAVEAQIEQLLETGDVAYIHVRDTDAGCYGFRIERTDNEAEAAQIKTSVGGSPDE